MSRREEILVEAKDAVGRMDHPKPEFTGDDEIHRERLRAWKRERAEMKLRWLANRIIELEEKLAETAQAVADGLEDHAALMARCAELERDRERLDWLTSQSRRGRDWIDFDEWDPHTQDIRVAIDAARGAAKG